MSYNSMERKFDYLINNRVIWRRDPITDKPDCDHCGIELTVGDHPSCCSNCWEENAKYYE